ncbi:hypothetical protein F4808DRAFT_404687 [Astrocystis sublimbata]|nr:hypothetical protein F4808DRAFT_404687 [Astrocystis sublimbata]
MLAVTYTNNKKTSTKYLKIRMAPMISEKEHRNYELFQDCLATALIEKISEPETKPKRRTKIKAKAKKRTTTASVSFGDDAQTPGTEKDEKGEGNGPVPTDTAAQSQTTNPEVDEDNVTIQSNDLADFTEYIATETFASLPPELKACDYHDYIASPLLQAQFPLPLTGADINTLLPSLDPSISDSLCTYNVLDPSKQGIEEFLAPVLTAFIQALATPPPPPSSTRANACEICERDWINLSYHHLIPRFVHAKAVKRGWHREADLQNVAWLCGACHRFVHRFAGHEELARKYYTVERLVGQEEVRRWAEWVGRLRWKGR